MSLVRVGKAVGKLVVEVCMAAQCAEQYFAGGAAWPADCLFWQLLTHAIATLPGCTGEVDTSGPQPRGAASGAKCCTLM